MIPKNFWSKTTARVSVKPRILLSTIASLAVAASCHAAAVDVWDVTSGSWDTSSTNWLTNGLPGTFANGDTVEFSAATADSSTTLVATVNPASILSNGANTPSTTTINGASGMIFELGATGSAGTGNISDAAGLSIGYAGNLTYNGAGSSGATVFSLSAGSGTAAMPTIWNVASSKTFQISAATAGEIADLNGNTVNLSGAGSVTFANGITLQSSGGTGTINVNAGTLNFSGGGSRNTTISSSITVNVAPGATLNVAPNTGGGSVFNQVTNLNGGTLATAGGTAATLGGPITLQSGGSTITSAPALTMGSLGRNLGATVNFNITGAIATTTGTGATILTDPTTGAAYATVGATDWAAKNSANTAVVGLSSISGGYTTLTTGTFTGTLTGNADLTNTVGTYSLTGSSTPTTIRSLVAGNVIDLGGNTLATGGILSNSTLTISGTGSLSAGVLGGELVLNQSANTATVSAVITDNLIPSVLVKAGAGTVSLTSGANTYSGGTFVDGGILTFTTGSLGTAGAITVSGGTLQWGTSTTQDVSSRLILVNGSAATFDVNGNAVTLATSFGGGTTAAVSFKGGGSSTAKFTLMAANSYTGGTTVTTTADNTAVAVGNASAFGTGPVTILGTNTFGNAILVNSGINVSNTLTMTPTGSSGATRANLGLSANSTWSGNITVNGASGTSLAAFVSTTTSASTACVVSGNVNHAGSNANILALRGSGDYGSITGNISYGTGVVQLLDTSNWQFSGASNTWGTLDIGNAGATAYVGATNTLSPSGVIITSAAVGATLKLNNFAGTASFDQTIGGLGNNAGVSVKVSAAQAATLTIANSSSQSSSGAISGSISLVEAGSAAQTLTGTSSYTGTTTVKSGTLIVSGTLTGTTSVSVTGGVFQLGATNAVKTSTPLILGGGTVNSAGFNQTFGTLNLSTGASTIDFGAANAGSVLLLADSTGVAWGTAVTLSIADWNGSVTGGGADQLLFANTGGGLTAGQLASISFVNPTGFASGTYGARTVASGSNIEIVPIPEPSTLIAFLGGAGMLGLVRRRAK